MDNSTVVYSHDANCILNEKERRDLTLLLVESDVQVRNSMRQALVSLGYEDITDAGDNLSAIGRLEEKNYTHVIFDTRNCNMLPREFLTQVFNKNEHTIALPSSSLPTVDEVFDLLMGGARGYIVKPFTAGSLDEAISWATKGDAVSDAIMNAGSRNEALASLLLSSLDKLALVLRQAKEFETAKREIPKRWAMLHRAMEISRTFAKGGDPELRTAIVDCAIKRSSFEAQHIGAIRRRRKLKKTSDLDVSEIEAALLQQHLTE